MGGHASDLVQTSIRFRRVAAQPIPRGKPRERLDDAASALIAELESGPRQGIHALLRHLKPLRHPYLLGGAISAALMAGVVAAFISVTALVAQHELPDATPGISSSPSGTLTIPIAHAHPSRHASGAVTASTRSTPFTLSVPTTSITAPAPTVTVTVAVTRTPTSAGP